MLEISIPPQNDWTAELRASLTQVSDLAALGLISDSEATQLTALGDRFKIRITPYYASLMKNSPSCPIRLQGIPALGEEDPALPAWATELSQSIYGRSVPWHADAIGDLEKLAAPRLTHRYGNRALLHFATMCAVYCRFCFRKGHLNEQEEALYSGSLDPALDYLRNHTEIRELILTGGDPLSGSDSVIARFLDRLSQDIPHLRMVRIHSRMAATLPLRLTSELAQVLGKKRAFRVSLVSHFNHPQELTVQAHRALDCIAQVGVNLYNQSVLLKGVNDDVDCLNELFQTLYEWGVTPFYLHHADWTPGTFHFRVSIERGQEIARALRGRLSGPASPLYVLEIPQGYGKISLLDSQVLRVQTLAEPQSEIQGALYEITSPHTRTSALASASTTPTTHRYLDLYR